MKMMMGHISRSRDRLDLEAGRCRQRRMNPDHVGVSEEDEARAEVVEVVEGEEEVDEEARVRRGTATACHLKEHNSNSIPSPQIHRANGVPQAKQLLLRLLCQALAFRCPAGH